MIITWHKVRSFLGDVKTKTKSIITKIGIYLLHVCEMCGCADRKNERGAGKVILVTEIGNEDKVADIFTKPLNLVLFVKHHIVLLLLSEVYLFLQSTEKLFWDYCMMLP